MGRACRFRDYDVWHRPDKSGMNKVGYITSGNTVIHQVRQHFVEIPFGQLSKKQPDLFEINCSEERKAQIEAFFTLNMPNPDLMQRGLQALLKGPHDFFENPVRLPKLFPISKAEHEKRWNELPHILIAGDCIQVFDENSFVSKIIAAVDHGCWSHSAVYTGDQTIIEAVTAGCSERPVSVYKDPRFRLGVYRHPNFSEEQVRIGIAFLRAQLGKPYAWRKVFILGLQKLLHIHRDTRKLSPNDIVARSDLQLIFLI